MAYSDWPRRVQARASLLAAVTINERPRHDGPIVLVDYDPAWPAASSARRDSIRAALGTRGPAPRARRLDLGPRPRRKADHRHRPRRARLVRTRTTTCPRSRPRATSCASASPTGTSTACSGSPTRASTSTSSRPTARRSTGCSRFRDHLRTNEADRELYERTKRELAAREWAYVQDYADAKTDVVEEIIARALA